MAVIYPKLWRVRVIPDAFRKRPKHLRNQSPGSAKNSNWGGYFEDAGKACLIVDLEPKNGPGYDGGAFESKTSCTDPGSPRQPPEGPSRPPKSWKHQECVARPGGKRLLLIILPGPPAGGPFMRFLDVSHYWKYDARLGGSFISAEMTPPPRRAPHF